VRTVAAFVAGAFVAEVIDIFALFTVYAHDGPYQMYELLLKGIVLAPLIGGLIAVVWAGSVRQPPAD
jgi:hypothetical protein